MIVGILVALILLLIIIFIIVIIIIIIRRRRRMISDPISDHGANVDKKDSIFPKQSNKPVPFDKFSDHVAMLEKDTCLEYTNEFEVRFRHFLHSYTAIQLIGVR